MGKDPAFLFYSSDFLTGTMMMTDEEVGKYIRLLCYQHQHGHINEVAMQRLCGGNAMASIREKFKVDSNGLFFNQRLEDEMNKRKIHSEKQSKNARMRWHKSGIATAMPLENENGNRNENKSKIENRKGGTGGKTKIDLVFPFESKKFKTTWSAWLQYREEIKKPYRSQISHQAALKQLSKFSEAEAIAMIEQSIASGWQGIFEIKNNGKRQTESPESKLQRLATGGIGNPG